jgi:hypothetical protein
LFSFSSAAMLMMVLSPSL